MKLNHKHTTVAKRFILPLLCVLLSACGKTGPVSEMTSKDPLVQKGYAVYKTNCIACHNVDPNKDGSLGPAIKGASLELLSKRILEGKYPPNYKSKRDTSLMQAMPYLKNDLTALHAYLTSP